MNNNRQKEKSGFTLIEVAVVLFIMGIFVSFASTMLRNLGLSTKLREARDRLTTASDAVLAATVKSGNRELPSTFRSFTSAVGNSRDYWNQQYRFYSYTTLAGVERNVCRRKSSNLSICLSASGTCTGKTKITDIAYVIVSTGDNLAFNTAPEKDTTNAPCSTTLPCVSIPINEVSKTTDDLYKYVTLLELKKTVGCVEADSGLRILNNGLPPAQKGLSYDVSVWADGGQSINNTYTWSVTSTPPLETTFALDSAYKPDSGTTRFRVSGTPTALNSYNLTFKVTDNANVSVTKSLVLIVE